MIELDEVLPKNLNDQEVWGGGGERERVNCQKWIFVHIRNFSQILYFVSISIIK